MKDQDTFDNESLDAMSKGTLGESLGIKITHIEEGYVTGTMPVDERTRQPYGLLHGGASVALAETLGSVGSHFIAKERGMAAVGVEINANHLRAKREGLVTGKAKLVHKGGKLHVWTIDIVDESDQLIATSRLTTMLIPAKKES